MLLNVNFILIVKGFSFDICGYCDTKMEIEKVPKIATEV